MNKLTFIPALPLLCLAFLALPARADLLLNSSFENPPLPTPLGVPNLDINDAVTDPSGITSWTVSTGDVTLVNPGIVGSLGLFGAEQGSQYVVLNGLTTNLGVLQAGAVGTLQQNFAPTAGTTYQVQFDYQGLGVSALNGTAAVQVNVSNASGVTIPNSGLINVTAAINTWTPETFTFVANSNSSTISFGEPTGSLANADGVALDNVSITAVPEPSTTMAWCLGFVGVLAGLRSIRERRSRGEFSCPDLG